MDEFQTGLNMISLTFGYCWGWFGQILSRAGALVYLTAAIFTFLVYRFFLAPLIGGSGGSDKAKKSGKKGK